MARLLRFAAQQVAQLLGQPIRAAHVGDVAPVDRLRIDQPCIHIILKAAHQFEQFLRPLGAKTPEAANKIRMEMLLKLVPELAAALPDGNRPPRCTRKKRS